MKKILYFLIGFVAIISVGITAVVANKSSLIPWTGGEKIASTACGDPTDLGVKNILSNSAEIYWDDATGSEWEYVVQDLGGNLPLNTGGNYPRIQTSSSAVVTTTFTGVALQANSLYEFYVRSICSGGRSNWVGPMAFHTQCTPIAVLPFAESFDQLSKTRDCWTIVDNDKDGKDNAGGFPDNKWGYSQQETYKGNGAVVFNSNKTTNDDWLISPQLTLNGGLYELIYYYKNGNYRSTNYEVKLSNSTADLNNFTINVVSKKVVSETYYTKVIAYVTGVSGSAYLGWHVLGGKNDTQFFVDEVSLTPISCYPPEELLKLEQLKKDSATISWTDGKNTQWEYYVAVQGSNGPVGSGILTSKTTVTATTLNGGGNLQPATTYDFYVRSVCGIGKASRWVGPLSFKTLCSDQAIPFVESFDSTSSRLSCWTIIDQKTNKIVGMSGGEWSVSGIAKTGDGAMYYAAEERNDDWLMSVPVVLNASKNYRVKYDYRTSGDDFSNFEVMLSDSGGAFTQFKRKILEKKNFNAIDWNTESFILSGVGGSVSIGFHMIGKYSNSLYIDNFSIEEVGCPEPYFCGVQEEKSNQVTLFWTDDVNASWEYVMQLPKGGKPVGAGTTTTKKQVVVSQLTSGANLTSNTLYEYYVRSVCKSGSYSDWQGPYAVRTACDVLALPFVEGFNTNSNTKYCWSIIDGNNDGRGEENKWFRSPDFKYEGTHGMKYQDSDPVSKSATNDWLVSPSFTFVPGKIYRLTYQYAVNEEKLLELYASNKGIDMKDFTILLEKNHMPPDENLEDGQDEDEAMWRKNKLFLSTLSGTVNLGWKVKGKTEGKEVAVDLVKLEEVVTCPEPLSLDVSGITSDGATLKWKDNFGATQWNYVVQAKGGGIPTGTGVAAATKAVAITTTATGAKLDSNTSYEFYVRTACGNGTFSDWSGPFVFKTLCGVYKVPFWEGFNTNSKLKDCWTTDSSGGGDSGWSPTDQNTYEGDGARFIDFWSDGSTTDDWLISPAFDLEAGQYILKYHYLTNTSSDNEFAVKLATGNRAISSFTQTIVPQKVYHNGKYVEEVVVFTVPKGIHYIGWQVISDDRTELFVDNVFLKKVENCLEPYNIAATTTTNAMSLTWKQDGQVQNWEVKVVDYVGDENSPALASATVSGNPMTTINGLSSGRGYKVYVRSKCMNNQYSDWSTGVIASTKIVNDECAQAVTVPVNATKECVQVLSTSLYGATDSQVVKPDCNDRIQRDVWYEFTATNRTHILSFLDVKSTDTYTTDKSLAIVLYEQGCNGITTTAKGCYATTNETNYVSFKDLTVGHKYLIRIGLEDRMSTTELLFKLCLSTYEYIEVSETKYTPEELVKKVLVESTCDLISNFKSITGTAFGESNGIAYFDKGKSDFLFKKGVVLATNKAKDGEGPGGIIPDGDSSAWLGDNDLEKILIANGREDGNLNASVIEFDFIPISNDMRFNFLFASNEYGPQYQCEYSDIFAFLLTDLTTNEVKNLAVIPKTDIPVSVTTIRDAKYQGRQRCGDTNKEYFDRYYGEAGLKEVDNAINYAGRTIPMEAFSKVVPGRKYHIKMAIADYRDSGVNSAVFLEAGSFKIGDINLGKDLLVDTGTALCSGTTKVIDSQMDETNPELTIKWFKDGQPYPAGDKKSKIEVKEGGVYEVEINFMRINCPTRGKIKVEIYPDLVLELNKPTDIPVCRFSKKELLVDLTVATKQMIKDVNKKYDIAYYTKEGEQGKIDDPTKYVYQTLGKEQLIYVMVTSEKTKCKATQTFKLIPTQGMVPEKPKDVAACNSYALPQLGENQSYYSEAGGKGKQYKAGDVLGPGKYELFVYQDNGGGCYEEVSFKIEVTRPVGLKPFEDVRLECSYYVVPKEDNKQTKFYRVVKNELVPLTAGTIIYESETEIVVIAETENKVCKEEARFVIRYNDCPIPKGISPNGDGLNDAFDLSQHGATKVQIFNRQGTEVYSYTGNYTNQWNGKTSSGKDLPSGTYYYVIHAFEKTRTGWVEISR